jgi:enterochelin esterase-like enzyme
MSRATRWLVPTFLLLTGCSTAAETATATPVPTAIPCSETGTTRVESVNGVTDIGIYLPPCYDENAAPPYPVLYFFPGFSGAAGDWIYAGAAKLADAAILTGEVPPFLIVSTDDLFPDIDANLAVDTVMPWVESRYRAGGERRLRAAAGGSFGGAAAYHLVFKHPDLFASAGIFGNGAAYGEEKDILAWLAAIPAGLRPRVFLASGEGDTYMVERARVMISLLEEAGIAHEEVFGPGRHDYETWLSAFPAYLRWAAPDWRSADVSN